MKGAIQCESGIWGGLLLKSHTCAPLSRSRLYSVCAKLSNLSWIAVDYLWTLRGRIERCVRVLFICRRGWLLKGCSRRLLRFLRARPKRRTPQIQMEFFISSGKKPDGLAVYICFQRYTKRSNCNAYSTRGGKKMHYKNQNVVISQM